MAYQLPTHKCRDVVDAAKLIALAYAIIFQFYNIGVYTAVSAGMCN